MTQKYLRWRGDPPCQKNPFSKSDWKKSAWKAVYQPEKAGLGWLIGGAILMLAVVMEIVKGCLGQ